MTEELSQEATEKEAQEPDAPALIHEFRPMTKEATIREYEQKNRHRIEIASPEIKEAFNKIWKKITGKPYYQPITVASALSTDDPPSGRIDPAGCGYKGYWEVVFSAKGRESEPNDVLLLVGGHCLQLKRSEPVVLPGPFLECADHGVYPVYKQLPGVDRKIISWIKHFPYTVLRKATEAEYNQQVREGNAAVKAEREAAERGT